MKSQMKKLPRRLVYKVLNLIYSILFDLKLIAALEPYLKRRGSDACGSVVSQSAGVVVEGRGCVLNMRGCLTEQPLHDAATGDWLLWNGEVFGGRVQVRLSLSSLLLRTIIYTDHFECVCLAIDNITI